MTASKQPTLQQEKEHDTPLALFDMNEVAIGRKLGSGGFCDVYEVRSFHPSVRVDLELSESQRKARHTLAHNAKIRRLRESRYAVKFLQHELACNPKRLRIAKRDIETEALILWQLDHRNIIKIRGCAVATGTPQNNEAHDRYFVILDRLNETLNDRLEKWRIQARRLNNPIMSGILDHNGMKRKRFLVERLQVATEIASAIEYLHENRIIYRDLKPGNVGFEAGTNVVKLFDFGLARTLPEGSDDLNDTFKMSGKVGTYRFMAPEVSTARPYNELADVYSFSHLLYMLLALEKPYPTYSKHVHRIRVARGGERPPISSEWPREIQKLLQRAWSPKIFERPSMTEVIAVLKEEITEMTGRKPLCDSTTICSAETSLEFSRDAQTVKSVSSASTRSPSSVCMPKVISFTDFQSQIQV